MQRSRESEKLKPRKKDIKTNDINISVNIGNERNTQEPITESFNNAPQIVKEKVKVSKENNKNLESLILNLKTLIKTFSDKKKQVLNMKIDIPNNIFDLPDISIDSEEDITRFISIITEKIGELNILLQTKKSIPVDIPRETVYSRGSMPIQNYGYSNAFPFGGGQRLPPAFQRPVSYEDYINANRKPPPPAVTNPAVKPDAPTVPSEPPPIDPPPYEPPVTPDEPPPVTPVVDPVTPDDPVTPVIDPDSDYEDEPTNYAVPLNTRLMDLEGYKSKFYKTFSGNNGSVRSDFGYTNLVQAFDRVYNIVKQASDKNAQEGGLSEEEFNYTMDQFFAMDNSNGDFPSAKAYSMITPRLLTKSDKIGLEIPREVPEQQKDGMMKIYRLVKNGQMLDLSINGDYGGKFFNKNGDRYNIEDANTPMQTTGGGRRPPAFSPPVSGEEEFPDDGRTQPEWGHWYDGFFGTGPNGKYQDGL